MTDVIRAVRQRLASAAVRIVQKWGPHSVDVLGRPYVVCKDVFNPKFYLTSDFMAQHIRVRPEDEVLDMGTGSGIQAITAAQVAGRVIAVDISAPAVQCARENVRRNGLEGRVCVLQGDLFSCLPAGAMFDVIFLTPPYLEGRVRRWLDHALYDPGKSLLRRFLQEAKKRLKPAGYVQMVYSSLAEPARVLGMAGTLGWECRVIAKKKALFETFLIWKLTLGSETRRTE